MSDNLYCLLNPRSVAIIGASRNPESFTYPTVVIALACGYQGKLFLINPKADSILGIQCYPSVLDVPGDIDVALIAIPRKAVGRAVDECIRKGVKGMVIITAGYAEQGSDEGSMEQDELVRKAQAAGIRFIGPNTLGYFCAPVSLDLLMSGFIRPGGTALITQSGNLTTSLTFPGAERGLGFSYVIGLGNQADLQFHDLIAYFRADRTTRAIALHIEGLRDGRKFIQEVKETVKVKPVVVLKSGRTEAGAKAASSHTAAVAGDDNVYQAAFRQCGAIQVENFTQFNSVLLAFNQGKEIQGNRMCIISEGGGDCALTSDACIQKGLAVPELSARTQERLREFIPGNGSVGNPIDLAGWENVVAATGLALADERIDGVIVAGGFAGYYHIDPSVREQEENYVRAMCRLIEKSQKPVAIYSYFACRSGKLVDLLKDRNIPLYMDHHDAVNAMAALVAYQNHKTAMRKRVPDHDWAARGEPGQSKPVDGVTLPQMVLEPDAKKMLRRYNLPFPEELTAEGRHQAVEAAGMIGYPVVLKAVSRDIPHKSDTGCVKLGLRGPDEVREAFAEIVTNARRFNNTDVKTVLVSRMDTEEGVEIIIGGIKDPVFGPVVMFGLGGLFVEVLKDTAFRVCPIDEADAEEMIRAIKGFPLLTGARGQKRVDLDSIKDALLKVSQLMLENPWIKELDLNPVKVHEQGLFVLDARIMTEVNSREKSQ